MKTTAKNKERPHTEKICQRDVVYQLQCFLFILSSLSNKETHISRNLTQESMLSQNSLPHTKQILIVQQGSEMLGFYLHCDHG